MSRIAKAEEAPTVVHIVGIARRSGTNFLYDILRTHPEISTNRFVYEDVLAPYLPHLARFGEGVEGVWRVWEEASEFLDDQGPIERILGQRIHELLLEQRNRPAPLHLLKSPRCVNLEAARRIFPDSPMILLTRDGRDVVESTMRSFSTPFDEAVTLWRNGAREVIAMLEANDPGVLRVRFEDLLSHREETVRGVLRFLEASTEAYDFEAANALPARGSSEGREEGEEVEWTKKRKVSEKFQPARRSAQWSKAQQGRFAALAGREQEALGYPCLAQGEIGSLTRLSLLKMSLAFHTRRRLSSTFGRFKGSPSA